MQGLRQFAALATTTTTECEVGGHYIYSFLVLVLVLGSLYGLCLCECVSDDYLWFIFEHATNYASI